MVFRLCLVEVHNETKEPLPLGKDPFCNEADTDLPEVINDSATPNSVMLLNVHKDLTDALDLVNVRRHFVGANERRRRFFGNHNSTV